MRGHDILFCLLQDRVDGDVIAANPNLRAVASMKITPSDIDVAAATARRIPVTVIPPIVTEATADMHFGLLLAVARRVVEGDRLVRAGVFPGAQSIRLEGAFVWGKTHRPRRRRRTHRPRGGAARARVLDADPLLGPAAERARAKSAKSVSTTSRWTSCWPSPTSSRSTRRSSPRRTI